jgi:hypothetical protein
MNGPRITIRSLRAGTEEVLLEVDTDTDLTVEVLLDGRPVAGLVTDPFDHTGNRHGDPTLVTWDAAGEAVTVLHLGAGDR